MTRVPVLSPLGGSNSGFSQPRAHRTAFRWFSAHSVCTCKCVNAWFICEPVLRLMKCHCFAGFFFFFFWCSRCTDVFFLFQKNTDSDMANEWCFEVSKHSGQPSGLYGTTLFSQLCCDEKRNCWLDHGERQPVVLEDHSVVAHYLLFTTVTLKFLGVLAPYSNSHLDTIYVNEDKLNQSFFFF